MRVVKFVSIFILYACYANSIAAQHISDYVSIEPSTRDSNFHFPETHAFQNLITYQDQLTEGGSMPNKGDFTGYVPINGSSTNGYLGINSENYDGGVTMLDINYNSSNKLWNVTRSEIVDFSPVAGTSRNCSGGISPWGTFLTCEEIIETNDSNGDGYGDYGWIVEVDPVTKQVIGKHFAMGQVSHENVVVHSNQRTAYFGSDSNPGYIFKYVANNATDLSAGILYVYSGSKNGSGQWLVVPNTTIAERNSTNSYCSSINATSFAGVEDLEIGPDGKVYVAVKGENTVYRFQDSNPINGTTVSGFEAFAGNASYPIQHDDGITDIFLGYGHDNLAFDDVGNLYVLQDGEEMHIWMIRPNHTQSNPQIELFARAPLGSEPTGMTFSPDYKFMFITIQHPSTSNGSTLQEDVAGDMVPFNKDVTMVIARKEFLGDCPECITCDDGIQNGNETGIDCGGTECVECISISFDKTDVSCFGGNDGSVTANITGGVAPIYFEWDNYTSNETRNNLSAGTYTIFAFDEANNFLSATVAINQPETALLVDYTTTDALQGSSNGSIDVTVTGGDEPYESLWNTGQTTEDLNNLAVGEYSLAVQDANSCIVNLIININEIDCSNMSLALQANSISCYGDVDGSVSSIVFGGIPPINYEWNNNNSTSPYLFGLNTGSYQLTVTDALGCSLMDNAIIEEPEELIASIETFNESIAGESDGSATINVIGGTLPYQFNWSTGENNTSINNLAPGNYSVTVVDANDCEETISFNIAAGEEICNEPINLSVLSIQETGAVIAWDAIDGAQTYTVRFRSIIGSSTWTTFNTNLNTLILSDLDSCLPYEAIISTNCIDNSSFYTQPVSFTTTGCEVPCTAIQGLFTSNETSQSALLAWDIYPGASYHLSYRPIGGTWFNYVTQVPLVILFGLSSCKEYEYFIEVECSNTEMSNASPTVNFNTYGCGQKLETTNLEPTKNSSLLYPNPNYGKFTVEFNSTESSLLTYSIHDIQGKIMYENTFEAMEGINSLLVNNTDLLKGLYFIKIQGSNFKTQQKFQIQ